MTTERERQEYLKKVKKARSSGWRISFFDLLIVSVGVLTILVNLKQVKVSPKSFPPLPDIATLTQLLDGPVKPDKIGVVEGVKATDFSEIDRQVALLQYNQTSVEKLATLLGTIAKSDTDKARAIYTWIAYNIHYDVTAYLNKDFRYLSSTEVLTNRKAICSGYAQLYKDLAKAMGLEAAIIEGFAKGDSYGIGESKDLPNHAWNAVKIGDGWYLVDVTWGAGYLHNNRFMAKFNPHYFATDPQNFIYDHFPTDTAWQLLSLPISKTQFDGLANVSPQFFNLGLNFVAHTENTIYAKSGKLDIFLEAPSNVKAVAKMTIDGKKLDRSYSQVLRLDKYVLISNSLPSPGIYNLDIYAKTGDAFGQYPHVVNYKIVVK